MTTVLTCEYYYAGFRVFTPCSGRRRGGVCVCVCGGGGGGGEGEVGERVLRYVSLF